VDPDSEKTHKKSEKWGGGIFNGGLFSMVFVLEASPGTCKSSVEVKEEV
jgi:hypothetical protein